MPLTVPYSQLFYPPAPVVEIVVQGYNGQAALTALLDSGSDASMIPLTVLQKIKARFLAADRIRTVSGGVRNIELYAVTIQVAEHVIHGIEAVATAHDNEVILGRDVMNQLIITLDGIGSVTELS